MRRNDMICLFGAVLMALSAGAQQINGDMNHSGMLDVDDVTTLISHYLTGTNEVTQNDTLLVCNYLIYKRMTFLRRNHAENRSF